jgi:transcriptional regulator with XRE-family HTH domain
MRKKPPGTLQTIISARLKAVQDELGKTDGEMAKMVGAGRTAWSNWIKRQNMPEEEAMIRLCDKAQISLEWLYRGKSDMMPVKLFIRLELRLNNVDPNQATPEQVAPVAARVAALASP